MVTICPSSGSVGTIEQHVVVREALAPISNDTPVGSPELGAGGVGRGGGPCLCVFSEHIPSLGS